MPDTIVLESQSGFAGSLADIGPAESAGVTVRDRVTLHAATLIARGAIGEIASRLSTARGLELARGAKRSEAGDLIFIGIGPRSWLALSKNDALVDELRRDLGDAAAISDQSSGYAILQLSGPKVRATLEKGIGVDLHPRAFRPDDAAITTCAHFGVIIWQTDETPTYEIGVARSFAADFSHWLMQSVAEFGVRVLPPG